MIQAGLAAEKDGYDEEVILAAFLHDIGTQFAIYYICYSIYLHTTLYYLCQTYTARENCLSNVDSNVGHLLGERDSLPSMEGWGTTGHEDVAANYLEARGFPFKTCQLIRNHVLAKRYLCWKDEGYFIRLSNASSETLKRQGGPMTEQEAKAFEASGLVEETLKVRSYDEAAKVLYGVVYPPLEKYERMMVNVLTKSTDVASH